jgi:hypothetical protein
MNPIASAFRKINRRIVGIDVFAGLAPALFRPCIPLPGIYLRLIMFIRSPHSSKTLLSQGSE